MIVLVAVVLASVATAGRRSGTTVAPRRPVFSAGVAGTPALAIRRRCRRLPSTISTGATLHRRLAWQSRHRELQLLVTAVPRDPRARGASGESRGHLQITGCRGLAGRSTRRSRPSTDRYPIVMTTPELERRFRHRGAADLLRVVDRGCNAEARGCFDAVTTGSSARALACSTCSRRSSRWIAAEGAPDNNAQATVIPGVDLAGLSPDKRSRRCGS